MKLKKIDPKLLGKIFTGLSLVGVGAVGIITAHRTLKYEEILESYEGNKVKATVKTYWPSFVAGGLTCTSILLAERINLKEIAAITGVCTYLVNQREKVAAAVKSGDIVRVKKAYEETADEKMEEKVKYYCKVGPSVEETDRGDLLCFEGYSGRWFRSSEEAVNRAIKKFKNRFENGEYLSFNDFYTELGIAQTHFGHEMGYPNNPDYYDEPPHIEATYFETGQYLMSAVDDFFGLPVGEKVYNDEPILTIDVYTYPMDCWMEI